MSTANSIALVAMSITLVALLLVASIFSSEASEWKEILPSRVKYFCA